MERYTARIDVSAPIVPDLGLGGLVLRTPLQEVQDLVSGLGITKPGSFCLASPFEARYVLDHQIEIAVDVRNGKIFKLVARQGYRGTLFGKITVGMRVSDAISLEPNLYYDEADEAILCRGCDGIMFDIPEVDPPPEMVQDMTISAISVFASEIQSLRGQDGEW